MRGVPIERDEAWLRSQLNAMTSAGRFIPESRGKVSGFGISLIWCFQNLGLRMTEADRRHELYREAQFVMGVPVSDCNRKWTVKKLFDTGNQ